MRLLKKVFISFAFALVGLLIVSFCGCDLFDNEHNVTDGYFDTLNAKWSIDEENNHSITIETVCALPLTQYTYSVEIFDQNKELIYTSEKTTVNEEIEANCEITIEVPLEKDIYEKGRQSSLTITGISEKSPSSLKREEFEVTYVCNGEVYKTETVKGGKTITTAVGKEFDDLVFCKWYLDPRYTVSAGASDRIYRDKTLYGKYTPRAETLGNKITTEGMKSLVSISYTCRGSYSSATGTGSGVIFKAEGTKYFVLTNAHVVESKDFPISHNKYTYKITDCYGNTFSAQIYSDPTTGQKAINHEYDLACMYFYGNSNVAPVKLAGTDATVGESCIALGTPLKQKNAVTYGHVLQYGERSLSFDVIRHDAIVTNGCSGGPLLNSRLELVGINYAKVDNNQEFAMGLAIPISTVLEFLSDFFELAIEPQNNT